MSVHAEFSVQRQLTVACGSCAADDRQLLQSIKREIVDTCGFGSADSMRRIFQLVLASPPPNTWSDSSGLDDRGLLSCVMIRLRLYHDLPGMTSDRAVITKVCLFHLQLSFDKTFQLSGIKETCQFG